MRATIPAFILAAGMVLATAAAAQQPPQFIPSRDVTVTYRVPDAGGDIRMSWLAASQRMRMDLPQGMGWMVMGPGDADGFMVMEQQRMVMALPPGRGEGRGLMPPATARFTREGTDRVANLSCTLWRVEDRGEASRICLTDDGVALRAEQIGQPNSRMEATAVTYGPQDPARFERPRGYQSFQMPQGLGAPGGAIPPPGLR